MAPLSPLLVGEPGVGKNRLVYELARVTRKELYIVQGHEDVTPEDLVCAARMSDDLERRVDYILSPLATAMLRGGICFLDEIGKLRPRALAPLASVLDDRRYVDSVLLGERVHAHPGFRFVAATNSVDLESGMIPEFVRSRLRPMIEVPLPSRKEMDEIVRTRVARLAPSVDVALDHFWRLWQREKKPAPPSARDVICLFGLALSLADAEASRTPDRVDLTPFGASVLRPRHLEGAFRQLFGAKVRGQDAS